MGPSPCHAPGPSPVTHRPAHQDRRTGILRAMWRRWLLLGSVMGIVLALVLMTALGFPPWRKAVVDSWTEAPGDPSVLLVTIWTGVDCDNSVGVTESSSDIHLTAWYRERGRGPYHSFPAIAIPTTVEVQLASPRGDRRVLDRHGDPIPHGPAS